jgi:uncharacterized membrane protein YhaH (DUF805 family)
MQNSIVRGFKSILRFSGRDTRSQFWPYAGAAFAVYAIASVPVSIILFLNDFDMSPDAPEHIFAAGGLMFAALVALLAAAVARRLHDGGLSGYWGLLPLPFVACCCTMTLGLSSQFETGRPDMRLVFSIFASFLLYSAALILLVVLLARRGAPGPNRFG